jgi:predicted GH43/DUF377 family glycosyl hydrolase
MINISNITLNDIGGFTKTVYTENDLNILGWYPTNLNIFEYNNEYIAVFRSVNYIIDDTGVGRTTTGKNLYNKIFIGKFDINKLELFDIKEIEIKELENSGLMGIEDPKIIFRKNSLYIVCTLTKYESSHLCKMAICKLNNDLDQIEKITILDSPNSFKPEKNWMFPNIENNNFDFVYEFNTIVKNNKLVRDFHTSFFTSELDYKLRGNGTLLNTEDGYICIMHSSYGKFYNHFFCKLDINGKFIGISDPFIFDSPGIEFAAGIFKYNDNYIISYGKNDRECKVGIIPIKNVENLINKIEYNNLKDIAHVW